MTAPGPAFLVIGAARSGTTYLSRALASHPALAMTDPKEPNFLASGNGGMTFAGPGDELTRDRAVCDEHEWRRLFERDEPRLVGEASVTTIYYPEVSVPRIRQLCPDARLVAVLRAPWDRARSAWMLLAGQGRETLSFVDGLAAERERIEAGFESIWHYRAQSEYSRQLRPFVETFGDRLLVAEYERMVSGSDEIDRIFAHLGIEPTPIPELGRVNAASDARHVWLRRRMAAAHAQPSIRRAVRTLTPARLRRAVLDRLSADANDEPFPPGFVESFDDELAELRAVLGDRVPSWAVAR